MKQFLKKTGITALAVPLIALYSGQAGQVSAAEETKTLEYRCTGSAAGLIDVNINMDVEISSTVPESVEPDAEFSIQNSYTTISMEVTDILRTAANPLQGEVSQFNLKLNNATETGSGSDVVNVASEPLAFGPINIVDEDETVEFRVPEADGINVDLTADESGNVEISAGEIITNVTVLGGLTSVDVTCTPIDGQNLVLNSIEIAGEDRGDSDLGNDEDPGEEPGDNNNGEGPSDGNDDEDLGNNNDGEGPGADNDSEDTGNGDNDDEGPGSDNDGDDNDGTTNIDGSDNGSDDTKKKTSDENEKGGKLPKTATNTPVILLLGSILALAGGALVLFRKKQVMIE